MYKLSEICWLNNDKDYIESFGKWTTNKVVRVCPHCLDEKEVTIHSVTKTGNTYCNGCLRTLRAIRPLLGKKFGLLTVVGLSNAKFGGSKVLNSRLRCVCDCGNEAEVLLANLKSGITSSCGCLRKSRVGSKNYFYNQDLTDEERQKTDESRNSGAMQRWCKTVKEKFGNKCFICGSVDNLHSHHVESFKDNEELRLDVENGVCLCRNCHHAYHWGFMHGFKNGATKDTFDKFLMERVWELGI